MKFGGPNGQAHCNFDKEVETIGPCKIDEEDKESFC
jgi:hypothetical protein